MKGVLRTFSVVLLLTLSLMSLARRNSSGAWIAYEGGQDYVSKILLMTGDGGWRHDILPENICGISPRWTLDGKSIGFTNACSESRDFFLINASGSALRSYVQSEVPIVDYAWSPEGDFAFVSDRHANNVFIKYASGNERQLASGYSFVYWSPDVEWIYAVPQRTTDGGLDRIHVDSGRIENILPLGDLYTEPSWSPDSQMVVAMPSDSGDELFLLDETQLNMIPGDLSPPNIRMPRWSPDGEWIAFWGGEPSAWYIWRVRPDGTNLQQLSDYVTGVSDLQWSSDGQWLLFAANDGLDSGIFRVRADGLRFEHLGVGDSPQYAPVAGVNWRPLWLIIAAVGVFLVPSAKRCRP